MQTGRYTQPRQTSCVVRFRCSLLRLLKVQQANHDNDDEETKLNIAVSLSASVS
jgi:hypothetical protein